MQTKPRQAPWSVNLICEFPPEVDKHQVLRWLVHMLSDDCMLTPSNMGAYDTQGYWRWRITRLPGHNKVWLEREADVQLFTLTWC
jgi:hypothetical protein